mgnify:CR=1 FL=1
MSNSSTQPEVLHQALQDAIVRAVLERLRAMNVGSAGDAGSTATSTATGASTSTSSSDSASASASNLVVKSELTPQQNTSSTDSTPGTLELQDRVVTMASLSGRLSGIQRVVVATRAVVTPAVRDRLRELRIALAFASPTQRAGVANQATTSRRLYLHQSGTRIDTTILVARLSAATRCESLVGCPVPQAARELAAVLTNESTFGMWITPHWAEAQGLANRSANVRAIVATDVRMVREARRTWNANLLVLDPHRTSADEMTRLTCEFMQCESAK